MRASPLFWNLLFTCTGLNVCAALLLAWGATRWLGAAVDPQRLWFAAGVYSLALVAVSYWFARRISQPLDELARAADAIAAGDYRHRVYIRRRDEIGAVARSLNHMCQELDTQMTQLRQSNERQATVLGGMIEGVIAVDERQRIVFANTAAGRLFDFVPPAVEGRPLLEVVRNHALHEAVASAVANGRPQRLETEWLADVHHTAAIQATPLPGDPCPGVVLVLHDITELRRLETLRHDFVANVSHELKTPLTSIKAYAETLQNGAIDDPEHRATFLRRIEEQADRLHHLILDMLTVARIESDQQAFEIGPVSVRDAVEVCLENQRAAAEAKEISLVSQSDGSTPLVRADAEGLREILDNLVDNAVKYTPAGGHVTVRWSSAAGAADICVADTGIGIPEEELPRVFERFYRVDKARSREMGGTGLGLAIVKHLTHAFDGQVTLESTPDEGTTFTVRLPLA